MKRRINPAATNPKKVNIFDNTNEKIKEIK